MIFIIYAAVAILFAIGTYLILAQVLVFSNTKTVKLMRGQKLKQEKGESFNNTFKPLISAISKIAPMSSYTRLQYKAQLERLGISMTPEEYVNGYRIRAALLILPGLLFIPLGAPIFSLLTGAAAIIYYLKHVRDISDRIKALNSEIMGDLPRMIEMLVSTLSDSRDLISFFVKYRGVAAPALARELDSLIVDMQTGNMAAALKAFDARLRIREVSSLVAILSGVHHGGDPRVSLMLLEQDVRTKERERIKKLLEKNPRRVRTACFIITTLMVFLFMVPIVIMILDSLQGAGF